MEMPVRQLLLRTNLFLARLREVTRFLVVLLPQNILKISLFVLTAWFCSKVSACAFSVSLEDKEEILEILKLANESRFRDWTVAHLEGLKDLNLDLVEINDDQLLTICKLDSLKSLSLIYTQVSDERSYTIQAQAAS